MLVRSMVAAGTALLSAAAPAHACLPFPDHQPSLEAVREMARRAYFESAMIVDAEVMAPAMGQTPATLWVRHILKGSAGATVQVFAPSSCDINFTRKDQRVRIALRRGLRGYYAAYGDNGVVIFDAERRKVFADTLDALIGSPRGEFTPE